jgi:hypothetical protein
MNDRGRNPQARLLGGDKGRNKKQNSSLPGSPALWAGSFTSRTGHPVVGVNDNVD